MTDVSGPGNYHNATFVFNITVSQEFKDSEANLQPYAQVKDDAAGWPGEWGCWINSADLSTSGANHSCTLTDAAFNLPDGMDLQIGLQAKGAPAGMVTINSVTIIYAN